MTEQQHQQQDPPPEFEVHAISIALWLVMDAMDLEHNELLKVTNPAFEARVAFHQRLLDFVWNEPEVERYRLVKIVPQEENTS